MSMPRVTARYLVFAIFLVGSTAKAQWVKPPTERQRKQFPGLVHETFESQAMKTRVGYSVVLPASYKTRKKRYPVIYWLHGGGGNESSSLNTSRDFAALAATMALGFGSALSVDAYLPLYVRGGRGASVSVAAFTVVFLGTGWAIAAYGVGRWMYRFGATRVIVAGSVVVTGSLPVGAFLVFTESSLWMLYALMTIRGFGVGFLTTAGRSLVQRISDAAEIGRANSSNQFVRMLGLSCGTALAGGVLLFVVNHRHGSVAEVQDLLSGDHHVTSAGLAEAVSVGYGWAFILASMLGAVGLLFAVVLHRTLNVGSAEASTG